MTKIDHKKYLKNQLYKTRIKIGTQNVHKNTVIIVKFYFLHNIIKYFFFLRFIIIIICT